jgi:hypothetical protein
MEDTGFNMWDIARATDFMAPGAVSREQEFI